MATTEVTTTSMPSSSPDNNNDYYIQNNFGVLESTPGKFPLTFFEVTVASSVVLGFISLLISVYLTLPPSDYSFLKLPRSLQDLQILKDNLTSHAIALVCFLW